jgi:hypothetical protein
MITLRRASAHHAQKSIGLSSSVNHLPITVREASAHHAHKSNYLPITLRKSSAHHATKAFAPHV